MKFSIDKDVFCDVLFRVQGVCAQKSTLPILSSCLIEAHNDGRIEIHGTDLDVSVSTSCPAEVEEPGRIALAAKRLFDTVKAAPGGDVVLDTEPNHWAKVHSGRMKARMAGNHPDEFPQLPAFDDTEMVDLATSQLLDMIEKTFFSISTDEARASFTGAFLRLGENNKLQMVSTDGHRLSKVEVTPEGLDKKIPESLTRGLIVPRKGLGEIRRIIPAHGVVKLGVKGDDLLLAHDNTRLAIRLIPGRFPNFSQVIPKEAEHKLTVSRDALLAALKRAAFYTAKTGNTRLSLSEGTLEIYAFDPEAGELKEPVPCHYEGSGVSAGYNYRYLLEVLGVIEGEDLILEVLDTESPTVLRDTAREDVLYIVMPMQL